MAGGVVTHTLDVTLINNAGGVVSHTRDLALVNNAGGVVTYTRGQNTNLGYRGPQIRRKTLNIDRFAEPPTSALVIDSVIDLTATGETVIYTVPTGKTAIINGCVLLVNAAVSVTTDAAASVGVTPNTNDLFVEEVLVQIRSVGDVYSFWADKTTGVVVPAGATIQISVGTAATATTLSASAILVGILV